MLVCACVRVCVIFLFSFSVCYLFICISLQFGGIKVENQVNRFRMKEKVSSQDMEEDMHSILYLLVCFLS